MRICLPSLLLGIFLPATRVTEVGPIHFSYFTRTMQTPVHPLTDNKSLSPFFAYYKKPPGVATLLAILQLHSSKSSILICSLSLLLLQCVSDSYGQWCFKHLFLIPSVLYLQSNLASKSTWGAKRYKARVRSVFHFTCPIGQCTVHMRWQEPALQHLAGFAPGGREQLCY